MFVFDEIDDVIDGFPGGFQTKSHLALAQSIGDKRHDFTSECHITGLVIGIKMLHASNPLRLVGSRTDQGTTHISIGNTQFMCCLGNTPVVPEIGLNRLAGRQWFC